MKRLFIFGSSHTNYWWPTWADFIQFNYDEYHNWGCRGIDNYLIFHGLIEANERHKFTSNDTVIIMWTYHMRWTNLNKHDVWRKYGTKWAPPELLNLIDDIITEKGQTLKKLDFMLMSKFLLNTLNVNYRMTAQLEGYEWFENTDNVIGGYVYPEFSMYNKIFQDNWIEHSLGKWNFDHNEGVERGVYPEWTTFAGQQDKHPTPELHFSWAEKILAPSLNITMTEEATRLLKNWKSENYPHKDTKRIGKMSY